MTFDKHGITTILFDLDGTLIDSIELILASYRHTMAAHGREVPPDTVWLAGLGTPLWVQFAHFTDDQAELDRMVATYREHNLQHHDSLVREYPGVRSAVNNLHAMGMTLGIVTSKMRDTAFRGLAVCGYDAAVFEILIGADDVAEHKPSPVPILAALARLNVVPAGVVYVGDSPHDMNAGRAAEVTAAAVRWGPFPDEILAPTKPDIWIDDPVELRTLAGS